MQVDAGPPTRGPGMNAPKTRTNRRPCFGGKAARSTPLPQIADIVRIGGTQKPAEPLNGCLDLRHEPPRNVIVPAGMQYQHTCPTCGEAAFVQGPSKQRA